MSGRFEPCAGLCPNFSTSGVPESTKLADTFEEFDMNLP